MNNLLWKSVVFLLIVIITVLGVSLYQAYSPCAESVARQAVGTTGAALPRQAPDSSSCPASALQDAFSRVAEQCSPAVVMIRTGKMIGRHHGNDPYSQLYNYFFGRTRRAESQIPTGLGSGFFVTDTGYVLTNYHIVRQQDVFRVILHDKSEYPAVIVGVDPLSDLAVLKIEPGRKVPYLEFADSDQVRVGQWAIAIGAPFSLDHTVTAGIISHKRRAIGTNVYENFIQTDASINQGNSGGPLLNLEGRVIGVNDFILTPSAGNIGLGFAIAGNLAREVCHELIGGGRIIRPWLGISMVPVPDEHRRRYGLDSGVYIVEMMRGGPADRGGLKSGDIIIAVNNNRVFQPNDVQMAIRELKPGDKAELLVRQSDGERKIELNVGRMPDAATGR